MLMEAVLVDIVSRVVTPRATLAGTAWKYHSSQIYFCIRQKRKKHQETLGSIQKENQETMTSMQVGT